MVWGRFIHRNETQDILRFGEPGSVGNLLYIGVEILPSYIGITKSNYKDHYEPIRMTHGMSEGF